MEEEPDVVEKRERGATALQHNGHRSFAGHVRVVAYLQRHGLVLLAHEEQISRDGQVWAAPDLLMEWTSANGVVVTVYVEVKFDGRGQRGALNDKVQMFRQNGPNSCVFGFMCNNRHFWYACSYGSHHNVIRAQLTDMQSVVIITNLICWQSTQCFVCSDTKVALPCSYCVMRMRVARSTCPWATAACAATMRPVSLARPFTTFHKAT